MQYKLQLYKNLIWRKNNSSYNNKYNNKSKIELNIMFTKYMYKNVKVNAIDNGLDKIIMGFFINIIDLKLKLS